MSVYCRVGRHPAEAFARDDAKRDPRTLANFDAHAESIREAASDAGTALDYSAARGVTISGHPAALHRAISNLIGPGIPRSEREKVFEPFYRIVSGSVLEETCGEIAGYGSGSLAMDVNNALAKK